MTIAVPKNGGPQDLDLADQVREHIRRVMPNPLWIESFVITAHNGQVDLAGQVRTRATKERAESAARQVPGVTAVKSSVLVDTDLEIAVAGALGADPRTVKSFPGILVGSQFGEMVLRGWVASAEVKQAAQQIAATVPGVRLIKNLLQVVPQAEPAL